MTGDRPIPNFSDPNFQSVSILECGEPIVELRTGDRLHVYAAYHARGFATATPSVFLRTAVIDTLRTVVKRLPQGINLVIFDGLRSLQTQEEIANRFADTLARVKMTNDERSAMISRFVAPLPASEKDYRLRPPSHATGAAVDLSLAASDGLPLDLGADFDQFDDTAATAYYEQVCLNAPSTEQDRKRRDLRRMLYWAMIEAGFAPYPDEFWHFEMGTQRAAAFYGASTAKYGAAVPWLKQYRAVA